MDIDRLRENLSGQSLASAAFYDLTVKCGDRTWSAHKVILSCQSRWFERALCGGFSESTNGNNEIELKDDASYLDAIDALMSFFYTLDYDPKDGLFHHARVFVIADKYDVGGLQWLAVNRLSAAAAECRFKQDFADLIEFVYDNTLPAHRTIRDSMLNIAARDMEKLLLNKAFVTMLDRNGEFARELLQTVHDMTVRKPIEEQEDDSAAGEWGEEDVRMCTMHSGQT
ncbi:hypothetical protein NA57DRAFT_51771 [Rhizodiscina lignyota]|uniref:BTB domain-containing protein n=1 Tax=Rhizodiscina lignyota TaxID=1504668 RepID=A0A9P4IPP9_9PEZI|nr:hypothetical protein NA57DRAFT_51771 [Rhizodiscina lignyota]